MKTKTVKRVFAAMLAGCMATSMMACGTDGKAEVPAAQQEQQGGEAEANEGPWYKYPEPVTLTRAQSTITNTQWPDGADEENNIWIDTAKEKFNIDLQSYWSADGSQYGEKINIGIASQDLPDVFTVNTQQLQQCLEADLILPLDEVYEKNASPKLREIMEADPVAFESGRFDGKLMALSQQHYGIICQLNLVWIRDDWMQKLNLKAPETFEELTEICEKFVTEDPDGNGKDDTYGLACSRSLSSLYNLMPAFHANPGMYIRDEKDEIDYGTLQPEMKNALAAFQDWYKRGILSKEFATMDGAKELEDIAAGKVGVAICAGHFGYNYTTNVVKQFGPDAIFKPYLIPSSDGEEVKLNMPFPAGSYIVVNKKCKNPEAVIRMINLYVHEMNESMGEEYDSFIANDMKVAGTPFDINNPNADYAQFTSIREALKTGDESKLLPDQKAKYDRVLKWRDEKDPNSIGEWTQVGPGGAYELLEPVMQNKQYVYTEYRNNPTQTMIDRGSALDALRDSTMTKIIMGELPVDAFDSFVEEYKNLGGAAVLKEMTEMLNGAN